MLPQNQNPQDTKNDLWKLLSLAVSSDEFNSLPKSEKSDLINTFKEVLLLIPS